MASSKKMNPSSRANPNTGFGVQTGRIGGRFVNRDGSFNLRKEGWPWLKRLGFYSKLLQLSWPSFIGIIILFYFLFNICFTGVYILLGPRQLAGMIGLTWWEQVMEMFFFSTQTFTTVGYGRVNPVGIMANFIASIESMAGWLFFAIVTGLLYGRFTRPRAYIAFSEHALISPYHDGTGLMFRMVPYKSNHFITDARVVVNVAFTVTEGDKKEYKFFDLVLERSRIDAFNMNWTVVHPIDQQSPLVNFTPEDMERSDFEFFVQVTGFDHIFSNMVMQRTSYTYREIIWGARFLPMYHESEDGATTILELQKLNDHEPVAIKPLRNTGTKGFS
jgi:inward rectifier potassium channel